MKYQVQPEEDLNLERATARLMLKALHRVGMIKDASYACGIEERTFFRHLRRYGFSYDRVQTNKRFASKKIKIWKCKFLDDYEAQKQLTLK